MSQTLEGRRGEPFTMVVELGKVREFARATKSTNPAYEGGPGAAVLTPATFLASSAFWQTPAANPFAGVKLNWQRILHGEQEFVFHGEPPRAGTVLTGEARIDRVYEKAGKRGGTMIFTDLVTEYRDSEGRLVAESRGTLIETSKATTESQDDKG
ncbi:MAG: FAS1-like dehydratase domain-containing protein [Acidimicrobiia bacterium]